MTNWYYTDVNGQKQELSNNQQLKELAAREIITPDTLLETDTGYSEVAGQIPGLFTETYSLVTEPEPPPADLYCTNCGHSVAERAYACMFCGANPTRHKKFCRHCGVALQPEQVVCIKCGFAISGHLKGIRRRKNAFWLRLNP